MAMRSESRSQIKKFFEENKSLKFLLPILAILIIAVIIVNLVMGKDKDTVLVSGDMTVITDPTELEQQQKVEVLPQIIRSVNAENVEVSKDPFTEPMKLIGVIYSEKRPTAIIQWGDYSYIVEKDHSVGESQWRVVEIGKDKIALESAAEKKILYMDGSFDFE